MPVESSEKLYVLNKHRGFSVSSILFVQMGGFEFVYDSNGDLAVYYYFTVLIDRLPCVRRVALLEKYLFCRLIEYNNVSPCSRILPAGIFLSGISGFCSAVRFIQFSLHRMFI